MVLLRGGKGLNRGKFRSMVRKCETGNTRPVPRNPPTEYVQSEDGRILCHVTSDLSTRGREAIKILKGIKQRGPLNAHQQALLKSAIRKIAEALQLPQGPPRG